MPTYKEIAEWLREAAATHRRVARSYGKAHWFSHEKALDAEAQVFETRADQVEAMDWQPISTAPKDGTRIKYPPTHWMPLPNPPRGE